MTDRKENAICLLKFLRCHASLAEAREGKKSKARFWEQRDGGTLWLADAVFGRNCTAALYFPQFDLWKTALK